jgi:hypothetical protein
LGIPTLSLGQALICVGIPLTVSPRNARQPPQNVLVANPESTEASIDRPLLRHDLEMARAALQAGQNAEALFALQDANRLAPSAEVYCAMAIALERLGRTSDAALRKRACDALGGPAALAPSPVRRSVADAPPRPLYKRWWLWGGVGVAVGALTLGLALGLTKPPPTPTAQTTFGTLSPF